MPAARPGTGSARARAKARALRERQDQEEHRERLRGMLTQKLTAKHGRGPSRQAAVEKHVDQLLTDRFEIRESDLEELDSARPERGDTFGAGVVARAGSSRRRGARAGKGPRRPGSAPRTELSERPYSRGDRGPSLSDARDAHPERAPSRAGKVAETIATARPATAAAAPAPVVAGSGAAAARRPSSGGSSRRPSGDKLPWLEATSEWRVLDAFLPPERRSCPLVL